MKDRSGEIHSCLQPDVQLLASPTAQISIRSCLYPIGSLSPALHGGAGISNGSNSQLYHDKSLPAAWQSILNCLSMKSGKHLPHFPYRKLEHMC